MNAEKPAQKAGRPRKHREGEKRQTFTFRMSEANKAAIQAAAAASQRSVSEEIEWRISRSIEKDNNTELAFTDIVRYPLQFFARDVGIGNASVVFALGRLLSDLEQEIGRPWRTDTNARNEIECHLHEAIGFILRTPPKAWGDEVTAGLFDPGIDLQQRIIARRRAKALAQALMDHTSKKPGTEITD